MSHSKRSGVDLLMSCGRLQLAMAVLKRCDDMPRICAAMPAAQLPASTWSCRGQRGISSPRGVGSMETIAGITVCASGIAHTTILMREAEHVASSHPSDK